MASDKPFNYQSPELWLLLSHIILSQTYFKLRNNCIEDSEVDNRLAKYISVNLVKNAKSVTGFSSSRKFRDGWNDVT